MGRKRWGMVGENGEKEMGNGWGEWGEKDGEWLGGKGRKKFGMVEENWEKEMWTGGENGDKEMGNGRRRKEEMGNE